MAADAPSHQTAGLGPGRHDGPGAVVCVMELASMLAGERFSDRPSSVCPNIGAILRAYNDNVDEQCRQDLYRFAAEAVGSRGDYLLQRRRAEITIAWASERQEQRKRLLRKPPAAPEPDAGPDAIAYYLIASLPRNRTEATHAEVLSLLDRLLRVGEIVEEVPQPVQNGGCRPELLVRETVEHRAQARLDAGAASLDVRAPAFGERGQHHAPVAV